MFAALPLAVALITPNLGAQTTSPASSGIPAYPVPYGVPTTQSITDLLDRVRNRLESGTGARFIDANTRREIDDLTRPAADMILDSGPERKFAPYSYPMGVVYSGMLSCAQVTGDKRYSDFVARRFQFFADNLPALSSWPQEDLRRNPFRQLLRPDSLDACGAMGAAMIKARRANIGPNLNMLIERFAKYVSTEQFRLDDGTLARTRPFAKSLWLDDAYMSVPLLAEMGKLTGERRYFDDAARQIKLFHKHLFVPAKHLYTHGGNMANTESHPEYFWGRANGWVIVATVELLDLLPANHPDRAELIRILQSHAKGIASFQAGNGMWHQMLDRSDSYIETSSTAMFAYAMARGANNGWLNASQNAPVAIAAWNGLTTRVSADGRLDGVCVGTGYADDYIYYYHRPATDDVHGYGPVLLAGSEMLRLVKNPKLAFDSGANRPVMVREASQ